MSNFNLPECVPNILTTLTSAEGGGVTYIGESEVSDADQSAAIWHIIKRTVSGGLTTDEVAFSGEFIGVWDDRTTYFAPAAFTNANSLNFDGVDEHVTFGDNFDFSPATAFSVSMWIKPQNLAAQRVLASKTSNDANVYGWVIYHNSSGKVFIQMRAPAQLRSYTFSTTLTAGVWQNVVFTYGGSQNISGARVYVDGVLDVGVPGSGTLTASWDNTSPFTFGRRATSFYYSGKMNQNSIWDKALSQSDVTEIYNSGSPADLSTHTSSANLLSWWGMSTDVNFPTEVDLESTVDGTLFNMTVGNYTADVP